MFGCAFRSLLPRADVQRICLFDTWLSSVVVGRSVATVAEVAFAAQWAIILHQLGTMTGADTTVNAAWVIVPLILIAECFSWHAVLTTNYRGNAIENSIWAVTFFIIGIGLCRLLPEFDGRGSRGARSSRSSGIVRLSGVSHDRRRPDVSQPLAGRGRRWQHASAARSRVCATSARAGSWRTTLPSGRTRSPGCRFISASAVWSSLALCVFYSLEDQLPRYRTEAAVASRPIEAPPPIGKPQPVTAGHRF